MGQSSPISYQGDYSRKQKRAIGDLYGRMAETFGVEASPLEIIQADIIDKSNKRNILTFLGLAPTETTMGGFDPVGRKAILPKGADANTIAHELTHALLYGGDIEKNIARLAPDMSKMNERERYLMEPTETAAWLAPFFGGAPMRGKEYNFYRNVYGDDKFNELAKILGG